MGNKNKKIIGASILIFLFTWLIVNIVLGATNGELKSLHGKIEAIDQSLIAKKPIREKLIAELDIVETEIITLQTQKAELLRRVAELVGYPVEKTPLPAVTAKKEPQKQEVKTTPTPPPILKIPEPEKETVGVNLDKLAFAIAMAETGNCKKGYGAEYNNCFGIKNGSIAPCKEIGRSKMCIYNSPEESYTAFKAIWSKGYGGEFPSRRAAQVWTGNDNPETWLANVGHHYNK